MESSQKYQKPISLGSVLSNALIIATATGLIFWSFRLIHDRFTFVISRDAVINGVLTDLKTPSEGTVSEVPVKTGGMTSQGQTLLTLKNERVSELVVQQITSKIKERQAELERAQAQMERQLNLLQTAARERENQSRLQTQAAEQAMQQATLDLKAAQAVSQLAQLDYKRTKFLAAEGALSPAALDKAALEMQRREAEANSLKARLEAFRTQKNAAQLSLSLDRSRSNYDPDLRVQEIQLDIANQRKVINTLQETIKAAQAELMQAKADVKRQKTVVVKAPTNGVIWRLNAQSGKFVQQGESIGQVLDCSRRWVDVFVEEQAVRSLHPGTPATIELYGSGSTVLQGRVSLVRSGLGRLAAGEDVAVPINSNVPRDSQVRVELDPDTDKGNPNVFCYVGYTGRVSFKVR